jgi:hypothetical protein
MGHGASNSKQREKPGESGRMHFTVFQIEVGRGEDEYLLLLAKTTFQAEMDIIPTSLLIFSARSLGPIWP